METAIRGVSPLGETAADDRYFPYPNPRFHWYSGSRMTLGHVPMPIDHDKGATQCEDAGSLHRRAR